MLWNTTSDERLLATDWVPFSTWTDFQTSNLDGFGLPLVGSLLGMLPREEESPEGALLELIHPAPPRKG